MTEPSLPEDCYHVTTPSPGCLLVGAFSRTELLRSTNLPISAGSRGGAAGDEWVEVPSPVTRGWKALGTERGLRDAALGVPSQNETRGFCRTTTKTMVVIMQICCIFQELGAASCLGMTYREVPASPKFTSP